MDNRPLAERLTEVIQRYLVVGAGTIDGVMFVQADTGNGWGVSVVCGKGTYGGKSGLWEASLTYGAPGYPLAHDVMGSHPDWGDVRGWLTAEEVGDIITMVAAYPPSDRKENR